MDVELKVDEEFILLAKSQELKHLLFCKKLGQNVIPVFDEDKIFFYAKADGKPKLVARGKWQLIGKMEVKPGLSCGWMSRDKFEQFAVSLRNAFKHKRKKESESIISDVKGKSDLNTHRNIYSFTWAWVITQNEEVALREAIGRCGEDFCKLTQNEAVRSNDPIIFSYIQAYLCQHAPYDHIHAHGNFVMGISDLTFV